MMNCTISLICILGLACVAVAGQKEQPQVQQPQVQQPQVQQPQVQQPQVLQPQVQQSQSLPIPYKVLVPERLQPGWTVAITGVVPSNAINFTLNFLCAPTDDVAFHFKPYFISTRVVRNHKLKSIWGDEEVSGVNPLRRSRPFQLKVTVESNGFRVDIDNNFFCFYKHQIPYHKITHLYIFSDIILTSVTMAEGGVAETDETPSLDMRYYAV